jgi:NlpC/P60 family putative phage cell wall peptidase
MNSEVIAHARSWIGTPYLHQASVKGVGCDCAGLVRGIWRTVHGSEITDIPAYTPDWSEPQGDEYRLRTVAQWFRPVADGPLAHGQLIVFRMRRGLIAKHLGLVATDGAALSFIHAYCGHGVVESPLSAPWQRRIVARFTFSQGD